MTDVQLRECFEFSLSMLKIQQQTIHTLLASNQALIELLEEKQPGFAERHRSLRDKKLDAPQSEAFLESIALIDDLLKQLRGRIQ